MVLSEENRKKLIEMAQPERAEDIKKRLYDNSAEPKWHRAWAEGDKVTQELTFKTIRDSMDEFRKIMAPPKSLRGDEKEEHTYRLTKTSFEEATDAFVEGVLEGARVTFNGAEYKVTGKKLEKEKKPGATKPLSRKLKKLGIRL